MSYTVRIAAEKLESILNNPSFEIGSEIGEIIQSVIDDLKSPDILLIEWGVEDVQSRARDINLFDMDDKELEDETTDLLTDEQAREVLVLLEKTHDCNYGITWDHIDSALDNLSFQYER